MRQLTYLEDTILNAIAETHPYPKYDVKRVYFRCNSFDKTIDVLEKACAFGITPDMQMDNEQILATKANAL